MIMLFENDSLFVLVSALCAFKHAALCAFYHTSKPIKVEVL